jgi:PAS domain S-box-containing protein
MTQENKAPVAETGQGNEPVKHLSFAPPDTVVSVQGSPAHAVRDPRPLRVLVIEDEPDTRANLRDILELDGHEVETVATGAEALRRADWAAHGVIILDWRLPDISAEELLPWLRERAPEAAIIISTGTMGLSGAVTALRHGAWDYILKPIDADTLRASLNRVSERKQLALEKERSEAAFRTLVEAAPCLITILLPDGTFCYFSPFSEELTGYTAEEVLGKKYGELFGLDPAQSQAAEENIRYILAGGRTRGFESPVRCKDGSLRWLVWNAHLLPHHEGGPAVLAVGQDITTLKQIQEQSLQAERLAAIGQMMTGLAHESGNALARSQACLEMLALEVEDRPQALDLIERIQKAQDHLQRLYEEVRGYAAPLKLDREAWDLSAIWHQAWSNLALQRQGKETVLHEHTNNVPLVCPVDQFRLEQVFRNILENALAACGNGAEIDVVCSERSLDGCPAVQLAFRDNGPGLSPEQRKRIFEPFFTTKTKGTGLGMAIAQRIIKAHGGQIAVGDHPGPGAEVLITLPRQEA